MQKSGGWQETPSTDQCGGSVPVIPWLLPSMTSFSLETRWHHDTNRWGPPPLLSCSLSNPLKVILYLFFFFLTIIFFNLTAATYVCLQVLVAPVVEKGAVQRDIYLPDGGFQWQDSQNGKVFDGGTLLQDYPVPLEDVAVFLRRNWVIWLLTGSLNLSCLCFQILKKKKKGSCAVLNLHFSTKDHWFCLKAFF